MARRKPPTDPIEMVVRNMFDLEGLSNTAALEVERLLGELFDEIAGEVTRINPTAVTAAIWQRARVIKLLHSVKELTGEAFKTIHKTVRVQAAEIAKQQSRWSAQLLRRTVGSIEVGISEGEVGMNLAKAIIDQNPIMGELMRDAFRQQAHQVVVRVRREIQIGMAQSETIDDMVRRIRGRSTGRGTYSGGVMATTTREAEAVVRTAVNDVANEAHMATFKENEDVIEKLRFVATLDGRTTAICASLDGNEYDIDDEDIPQPPLHWNCRSVLVPVIDWKGLGVKAPPEGERASMNGPVPADMTYSQWLKGQEAALQNDILGAERADMFRAGEVGLDDLVRDDGRLVRVEDL